MNFRSGVGTLTVTGMGQKPPSFFGDIGYGAAGTQGRAGAADPVQVFVLAGQAIAACDIVKARRVIDQRRAIRDLGMEALEVNARLFASVKHVAKLHTRCSCQ